MFFDRRNCLCSRKDAGGTVKMNDKVSVIIPAYNVEPWIERCLDSICAQTYRNLEIIVIDDGSNDKTGSIIDDYAKKDGRIIAVHQDNVGVVETREKGISMATGKYIGFVDGDDAIDADMYEHLVYNVKKYDADISHCGVRFCFPDGHEELHYGKGLIKIQNNYEGVRDLLEGAFVEPALGNKLYRMELLKDSCLDSSILYNEDLLKNYVLFSRSEKSIYEDFCGYQYFQREGSASKDPKKTVIAAKHIFQARRLIVENATEELYPYAMRTWLSSIVTFINTMLDSDDPQCVDYCRECRKVLRRERKNIHYLIVRQQFAAGMILFFPKIYKSIYQLYFKLKYR